MTQDASDCGSVRPAVEEAARFPEENPNPVFRVGADGCLQYANPASRALLDAWGVAAGDGLPSPWQERVATVLESGVSQKYDATCGDRLFQLHCVPIVSSGYVNVYGSDVTEREALLAQLTEERGRLAEAARAAEQRALEMEATLEAINDGVALYDRQGRMLRMNAAAGRILGYDPAKVPLTLVERAAWIRATIADDPEAGPEQLPLLRALRGETVRGQLMHFEPLHGDVAGGPRYVLASAIPMPEGGDGQTAIVASFTDVTELRAARDDLAQRVQELEVLLDLLPTGVGISYDPECKDIRVNPALARMLGMTSSANVSLSADEEARGAQYRVLDASGRELAADELPMQAAALTGSEVRDRVVDIVMPDGTKTTLLSYAVPLVGPSGERRGSVGAFVDITALRSAERERERLLAELRERSRALEARNEEIRALNAGLEQRVQERTAELEAVFASVPDALYVADRNGIVRCNQAALDGFGCTSVEELRALSAMLAVRMNARYAGTGEPIPPGELGLARALRGEPAVLETLTRHPLTGQDRVHRVTAAPIVLNGQIAAAVGLATDITEQKRAQAQIAFQADLLSRISDAVIAVDLQNCITSWNPAAEAMFGWRAAEVLGRPIEDVLPAVFVNTTPDEVYRQLAEAGYWRGELVITRRDGSQAYVEATSVPVHDSRGQIAGLVGVDRDISERKAAEAEAARLLGALRASHEQLRSLSRRLVSMQESERSFVADQLYNQAGQVLAALQLQLGRLEKEGDPPTDWLPTMRSTLNEAMRELHDLAAQLRPAGLDRSTLAAVLGQYMADFARARALSLQFLPGDTVDLRVPADVGTALFRSVQEGLSNVVRHSQATEVVLAMRLDEGGLVVTLADNGVGFDPASANGTGGVGLAGIRERLDTVGGQLAVTSGTGGTVLRMRAPLGQEELRT